jgi:hypothetical protein
MLSRSKWTAIIIILCGCIVLVVSLLISGPTRWRSDDGKTVFDCDSLAAAVGNQFMAKMPADCLSDDCIYQSLEVSIDLSLAQNPTHQLSGNEEDLIRSLVRGVEKQTQHRTRWFLRTGPDNQVKGITLYMETKVAAPPTPGYSAV